MTPRKTASRAGPGNANSRKSKQWLEGLAAFAEVSTDAFILFDEKLNVIAMNPAAEKLAVLLEVVSKGGDGSNILDHVPDHKGRSKYDKYIDVIQTGEPFSDDDYIVHPKTGEMHLNIRAFKVGKGLGVMITDITGRKQVDEELRQSEIKYRELADLLPLSVFEVDENGILRFFNRKCVESSGYTREEMGGGFNVFQLLVSEDRERAGKNLHGVLRGDESLGVEYTALRKDGSTFPVLVYSSAVVREGRSVGLRGIAIDLTERRRAEQALTDSEEKLNRYLNGTLDGIYTVDAKGRFRYVNKAMREILGYSKEEMIGKSFIELGLIPPDYISKGVKTLKRIVSGEPSTADVFEMIKKDGDRIYAEISSFPLGKGDETEIISVIRDISERKRMDVILQETEEKFRNVLNNSLDMFYQLNLVAGRYDYVSPSSVELIGYTPEEITSHGLEKALSFVYPDDLESLVENMSKLLEEDGEFNSARRVEYRFNHRELGYRWISDSRSVLRDSGNKPVAVIGTLRDITEQKEAEEELREYVRVLEFLSQTAMELVELTPDKDIYRFVGEKLKALVGDTVIFINSFDQSSETFTIRALLGLEKRMDEVNRIVGGPSIDLKIPISDDARMGLSFGKVVHVEHGIYQLACKGLPEPVCKQLEEFLNIGSVYALGQTWGGKLFGSAAFLVPKHEKLENIHAIETIMNQSAVILQKWQAEEALQDRLRFESLLSQISTKFVNMPAADVDRQIDEILAMLVEFLGVERSTLFELTADGEHYYATHSWAVEGVEPLPSYVTSELLPYCAGKIFRGEHFMFSHLDELQDEAAVDKELFALGGMKSNLTLPLQVSDMILGALALGTLHYQREWPDELVQRLRLVADVIANALDRKRSEEVLHDSEEKLRLMFESVSEGVFVTDLQGNITEVNQRGLELSGAESKDDLVGRNALEFIAPVERKKLVKAFQRTLEGKSRPQEYTLQKLNGTSCISETNGAVLKDALGKPVGFISAVRDITERKWVEEELTRYRYQLEEIVQERTYQLTDANERLKEEIVERKKTEEELRQSKEFSDKLIASMHDGVTVVNRDGVRIVVNDALCEMTGFSSEELLSQYPGPFWPPEEYEEIVHNLYRTYIGEISEFETNFMRKNGERFPALVSQSFINDDRGNPINYVSTIKDISERKQMEQALRESEEHFRSIAEAIPIPVTIAREKDGIVTYVNQHFGSIMGQSVEQILGRRIIDFYADPVERDRILNDLKKGMHIHNHEICARHSNGTSFWVIASIEPLVFGGEKCLMGVFYDISERKQMEDILRERGEYFRSLIENSLDVIAIMNPDGSVRYQSPYAGRILGYSADDRQIAENPFEFLHQKDQQGAREMFAELVQDPGSVKRAEIRARHRDGSWHSFEVVAKSLVEDPVVGGIVAHFYDMTERKREAEKLKRYYGRERKLRQQLEEEMQKRIEFTRALAHELKTPLTPIMMSSQILTTELKSDEVLLRVAENISRGAFNLNSRIDELLDLARGEVGMLQIRPQRMDLVELLREIIEEIAPVPLSRGQFLKAELPHAKPPVLPQIRADRGRVKQVVMNLLNNAFKYTPEGGKIFLNVKQDDSSLIVTVKDTGPGLPDKEQKRIFEPYHRVDSDREELGGLGLGLALCRRLVELHGGRIWVESQPGNGSTFFFALPVQGPVKQQ